MCGGRGVLQCVCGEGCPTVCGGGRGSYSVCGEGVLQWLLCCERLLDLFVHFGVSCMFTGIANAMFTVVFAS